MHLLVNREHSCLELQHKLMQREYSEADAKAICLELVEANYLSDQRYCEMMVNHLITKGYGSLYIEQQLCQKGVATDLIQQFLPTNAEDWQQLLRRVWAKKFSQVPATAQEKSKQQRFLLRRGFTVSEVVKHWQKLEQQKSKEE